MGTININDRYNNNIINIFPIVTALFQNSLLYYYVGVCIYKKNSKLYILRD